MLAARLRSLLAPVLVLPLVVVNAALAQSAQADTSSSEAAPSESAGRVELVEQRTASSRTYLNADGTLTTIESTQEDANFFADCPNCDAWATSDRLFMGTDDDDVFRAATMFDLGGVPDDAPVIDAHLELYDDGWCINITGTFCGGTSHTIDAHRMTKAWSTSSKTAQIEFDSTVLSSVTYQTSDADGFRTWDITSTVEDWLSGAQPNYGLLLKRSTEPLGASGPVAPGRRYVEPTLAPRLSVTYESDAVTLLEPTTLHSDGAELRWTPFDPASGAAFEQYEVHRSEEANFAPSSSTLLSTITDVNVTSFRDSTATAEGTFSYRVVANASPSNERRVTLPAAGQAIKVLQPGSEGKQTYLGYFSGFRNCANYGAERGMWVGTTSDAKFRPILQFNLSQVPAGATITEAELSLWHPFSTQTAVTVNVHRLTKSWKEGNGLTSCTGGATWYQRYRGVNWTIRGGDFASAATASLTNAAGEAPGWDDFNITSLAQRWVNRQVPNHGIILRVSDERMAAAKNTMYHSDDFTGAPTLRPKLVVTYSE